MQHDISIKVGPTTGFHHSKYQAWVNGTVSTWPMSAKTLTFKQWHQILLCFYNALSWAYPALRTYVWHFQAAPLQTCFI